VRDSNVPETAQLKDEELRAYYHALYNRWGAQHWWPARTRFEVIVGAYLTQNTAWTNVERALANLRREHALSLAGIRRLPVAELQRLIRPSGFFRQKARRLKTFFDQPTGRLREELLNLNGVGPETADSILLYAGNHPVFVVDAYTRRILERHEILPEKSDYEDIRELFQRSLAAVVESEELKPREQRPRLESGIRGAAHPPSPMSTARRTAIPSPF
jgi:endonuclease-3 related protein